MMSMSTTARSTATSSGCGENSDRWTAISRRSRRSMALATVFRRNDEGEAPWRLSLTARILAVNIFALVVLAGGFFYLDSYRTQLIEERSDRIATEAELVAAAIAVTPTAQVPTLLVRMGAANETRLRLYRGGGAPIDSWAQGAPTYTLRNPAEEPWRRHAA